MEREKRREETSGSFFFFFFAELPLSLSLPFCLLSFFFLLAWCSDDGKKEKKRKKPKVSKRSLFADGDEAKSPFYFTHKNIEYNGGTFYVFRLLYPR